MRYVFKMTLKGGFDTSNASVREHRSPQGEKRKATTKKEYTTHRKMGKREARREIKKRCQNLVLKQRLFYLPEVYSDTDL